jgi:hypothetical protein
VRAARRPASERLVPLFELEAGLLKVAHDALGELVPGLVCHMLSGDTPQQ